jgi:sterol desaturase/sphingolipid hydroxylase (fatty acid hydroxylase superfamily)
MPDGLIANSVQILLGTVIVGVAVVMLIESIAPLRPEPKAPLMRWIHNLSLTAVDYAVMFGVAPLVSMLIARTVGFGDSGLLHRFGSGFLGSFILITLCLEFVYYWMHRTLHAVPMLWRVHAVHHSDVEMDATTANRHHPLELVISTIVVVPVLMALGPDPLVLLSYNVLHSVVGVLSHGNFTLGRPVDRMLRPFIVTPDFHRQHHSADRRYTDSNYSNVLPLFDYIFRTATQLPAEQQKTMTMGLPYLREPKYARLDQLLLIPFLPKFADLAGRRAEIDRGAAA